MKTKTFVGRSEADVNNKFNQFFHQKRVAITAIDTTTHLEENEIAEDLQVRLKIMTMTVVYQELNDI